MKTRILVAGRSIVKNEDENIVLDWRAFAAEPPTEESMNIKNLRERWPRDDAGLASIPRRSWPERQPSALEIPQLKESLEKCMKEKKSCIQERFVLATALLDDPLRSFEAPQLYEYNAIKFGDADSACAFGQCLQYGTGIEENDELATKWYFVAAAQAHPQALYALGAYYYCGDGFLEENEVLALRCFAQAAQNAQHPGAMFMLADALLEGGILETNTELAARWLLAAGDRGHRGARSRLFALLTFQQQNIPQTYRKKNSSSKFTDASRQTLRRRKTELYFHS
mmetsp:Transcript_2253/g.2931  ORF Transcript_2253/g.2931 Transcript_2253/m.2931 type:complete len:283 (+) Transcript_2253:1-849(+)